MEVDGVSRFGHCGRDTLDHEGGTGLCAERPDEQPVPAGVRVRLQRLVRQHADSVGLDLQGQGEASPGRGLYFNFNMLLSIMVIFTSNLKKIPPISHNNQLTIVIILLL